MKRHIYLWLVMFLAISLALPIYSMADMKMTLMTKDGDTITSSPGVMNFFMSKDGTLSIILESPLDQPFRFAATDPDIGIVAVQGANCTIPGDGSVIVTAGSACSFGVASSTTGAAITPVALPGGSFSSGVYQWTPTSNDIGTYLAVFQADITGTSPRTSQIVVMIKVNPQETVNPPTAITPLSGTVNQAISFTASGATVSTPGHTVEYSFSFDGSTWSSWGSSAAHTYTSTGQFPVQAKARCATDHVESTVYSATVTISNIPTYTVTANIVNNPSSATGGSVTPTSVTGINYNGQAVFNVTINSNFTASVSVGQLSGTTGPATVTWTISGVTADIPNASITFTQQGTGAACGDPSAPLPWAIRSQGTWYFCMPENQKAAILIAAIGRSDDTYATLTWTFPDGRSFTMTLIGQGTDNARLRIWSANTPAPTIADTYIPGGRHTLTISGTFYGYFSVDF